MKWSWKLGRFAGIDVYMHATFLLLLGWVVVSHLIQDRSIAMAVNGVTFILALFACVVLHEYGHALTARRYGIATRDITLLPIGGVARLERMPDDPRQELWVALAGPAVNVVIAIILFAWLTVTSGFEPFESLSVTGGSFLGRLLAVNLSLVAFNLLPAFPMDGGRVLRALLALRMEYVNATHIAAMIGQGMALVFGFIGLFTNPFLLFIAFFVWIGAAQEAGMTQMRSALGNIPISRAMITDFRTLSPHDSLAHATDVLLTGSQHDFPVTEDNRVVGILTRADLINALKQRGEMSLVGDAMQREFLTADASEMLEGASERLQTCACHTMPVMRGGQLVGLVTMDNLGEFLMIRSALGGRRGNEPRPAPTWG
ncbi:MAG: site-2 protease family protein [Chloroflexi bacterium]|nr:site-2 protease family protein [Chloroflexota bacterium]